MTNLNKLHEALTTLAEECEKMKDCSKCPFYVGYDEEKVDCFFELQNVPCDWEPKEVPTDYFRFF